MSIFGLSRIIHLVVQYFVQVDKISNVPSFWLAKFKLRKNNARHQLMCLTRAAPAGFRSWACILNFLSSLNFLRLFFSPLARKIIFGENSTHSKSLKSSLHSNPAGASLVRHINWWRALFFWSLDLASQKEARYVLNNVILPAISATINELDVIEKCD